jgi:predicted CXXCH cytochrome family protein
MKKLTLSILTIALLMFAQYVNAQNIKNSAHDFSAKTWNTSGEICKVCHTPHDGNTTIPGAPLWNHALSTVSNYQVYTSSTLTATDVGQPDGSSKLCLSCHDGTVALENFGGVTSGTNFMTGAALVGTNLSNDHPVSFTYNTALAGNDPGLFDPATHTGIGTGTIQATMLFSNKMQCASCHDVHNSYGLDGLLVKTNAASALCLTCHNK